MNKIKVTFTEILDLFPISNEKHSFVTELTFDASEYDEACMKIGKVILTSSGKLDIKVQLIKTKKNYGNN